MNIQAESIVCMMMLLGAVFALWFDPELSEPSSFRETRRRRDNILRPASVFLKPLARALGAREEVL